MDSARPPGRSVGHPLQTGPQHSGPQEVRDGVLSLQQSGGSPPQSPYRTGLSDVVLLGAAPR